MSISRFAIWGTLCSVAMSLFSQAVFSGEFTEAEFRKLHDELKPKDEPWLTIPWKISLLDAQRSAAEEKRPIFIWAMDGHPLGCT